MRTVSTSKWAVVAALVAVVAAATVTGVRAGVVYVGGDQPEAQLTGEDVRNWHEPTYAPSATDGVAMRFREAAREVDDHAPAAAAAPKGEVDEEQDDLEDNTKGLSKQQQKIPDSHNKYYYPMRDKDSPEHLFNDRWVTVKTQHTHNWKNSHMATATAGKNLDQQAQVYSPERDDPKKVAATWGPDMDPKLKVRVQGQ